MCEKTDAKRILITGAAGFIGFHLTRYLLELGHFVIGLDNLNDYYDIKLKTNRLELLRKYDNFVFVLGNLEDEQLVTRLFREKEPQIVVNLAAQAGVRYSIENPQSYIKSNIIGFFNILESCRNFPVEHLVFASSSSVYGNQEKVPFSVEDPVDKPISLYAATKKSDELMAYTYSHLFGICTTGLRFFTVYGPWGRPDMAYFSFTDKILKGESIKVFNNGNLYRDFTYIDDIIVGISNVIFSKNVRPESYKIYNIGNNKPEKLLYFIEVLEECLGKKAQKEFFPMQPGDVYQTYADISGMEQDFGFKPCICLKDGIKKFVDWYLEYNLM